MSLSRAFFLGLLAMSAGCGSEVSTPESEPPIWVRRMGRSSDPEALGLAGCADGGVVMVGRYYGEIDFGGGKLPSPNDNYQAFVVKYDTSGNHVYSKSYGGDFAEEAVDVAPLSDGSVIVTGTFNWDVDFGTGPITPNGTDIFVLKLDSAGKTIWVQTFGGDGPQRPQAIAATSDGGVVLVGTTSGKFDIGLGTAVDTANDGFVLRLDSKGEPKWFDVLDSTSFVYVNDVAVHAGDGVIAVGGTFSDQLAIGSTMPLIADGYQDGFLAAYDDTGKSKWSRKVGGPGYFDGVNAIAMAPKESTIYVTGMVEGQVDLGGGPLGTPDMYDANTYVLAVATTGGHLASRLYGRTSTDEAYGLAVDSAGDIYVAGDFYDRIAFGAVELVSKGNSDAFVGKVHPNLEPVYQQAWGDSERQTAYRVAIDGTGRVYVAGSVFGTVDFGLGPTYSSGYFEKFLLALPR